MRIRRLLLSSAASVALAIEGCGGEGGGGGTEGTAVCTPAATEPCTCAVGRPGSHTCAASGDTWGFCTCAACGAVALTARGAVYTSAGTVAFDHVPANARLEFVGVEGTCLGRALLSAGGPDECALDVEFGSAETTYGGVRSIVLRVGPACPAFAADREGMYVSPPGWGTGWWHGPKTRESTLVCAEGVTFAFPDAAVRLSRADGAWLDVTLRDLTFVGDVAFTGSASPFLACVQDACSPSMHDGGEGWCVPLGACTTGFHDGGDGSCLPVGTCAAGFGLDADGTCLVWKPTGCMLSGRWRHAAFRLPSGAVLVTGGYTTGAFPHDPMTSEAYLSESGAWVQAAAPLYGHEEGAYSRLADGRVLAIGGYTASSGANVAELYVPSPSAGGAGGWTPVGPMGTGRYYHAATTMRDGRVLVTGGQNDVSAPLASAEIFDPAGGTWARTAGAMVQARAQHASALLGDGRVLVVGGLGTGGTAELYDPAAGTFQAAGAPSANHPYPVATSLPDGRALVLGGFSFWAEIFDPATEAFIQPPVAVPFDYYVSATVLSDGLVLLVGSAGAALLDPAAGTLLNLPAPLYPHSGASATLLPGGAVLVVGDGGVGESTRCAELYLGSR